VLVIVSKLLPKLNCFFFFFLPTAYFLVSSVRGYPLPPPPPEVGEARKFKSVYLDIAPSLWGWGAGVKKRRRNYNVRIENIDIDNF